MVHKNTVETGVLLERFLRSITQGKSVLRVRKNTALYYQGDAADAVFFLHSGRMKLVVVSFGGKEATLSVVRPQEFFGLAGSDEDALHLATAVALEPSMVTRVEHAAFVGALRKNPRVYDLVLTSLSGQILHLQRKLCAHLLDCSQQRLARTLLALSHPDGERHLAVLAPKISHRVLATMVGTTRSRITFFMNRFRSLGFVAPGRPTVIHTAKLTTALHTGLLDRASE